MPVELLPEAHRDYYGRYAGEPSPEQLARYFHLDDADRMAVDRHRGEHSRLGFAVQLGTVRFLGTFSADPAQVPSGAVSYLAAQLGIPPGCWRDYQDEQVRWRHAREIRSLYGYRDFGSQPESFRLVRWLYTRAWLSSERPSLLLDLATAWLVERKVLLPGVTVLERLVGRVRERAVTRLWGMLAKAPSSEQRRALQSLLEVPEGSRQSVLDQLRRGPVKVSGPALVGALKRLCAIREVGVGDLDLAGVPPGRLKTLARYAASAWAPTLARMPADRRIATLLAFARAFETTAMDDALELLDQLITELRATAKKTGQKARIRTLRDLDAAALQLREACALLLDEALATHQLRAAVFERVPRERLVEAVAVVQALARPADDCYQQELVDGYRRVRYFLPALLRTVAFQATPEGQAVLRALEFLAEIESQSKPEMDQAPLEIVPRSWRRWVLGPDGRIDRRAYTLCVLERLQDSLRRRDVFVVRSDRWGDTRAKLLQGADWEKARPQVCHTLGLDRAPDGELQTLAQQLDLAYQRTAANLPTNRAVRIESPGGRDTLVLTGLDKLEEPPTLTALRDQVAALLPQVDLPEALLEIHARTGFADEFTHISETGARATDLSVSLCAVLLAEACNIGLEPLVRRDVPALTRGRLSWVQQNYIRSETLVRANARLVDAQAQIGLAQALGGGEVASADGLRFVTPTRTVNAGPNPKYFGVGRGITYYNFTSDQFTGFHGIVVPGTLRDSMFLLEGLLEQQTSLNPLEIMTDTAGASDIVFGLFWLLGYQFSPRLADLGGTRLWRVDPAADYGVLNDIARHRVSLELITRHWDDLLRVAGSLKLGTVSASELMRTLLRSERPSALARALAELGRIPKTLHLLSFIDDKAFRRRILTQLNRGESRGSLARAVFHGQHGEVRQRYREGQEDQLGALGLVVNVIVLWNTLYMDAAINHLQAQGVAIDPLDMGRLSPLGHRNINFLGRYSFALADPVKSGQLRPLRDPGEVEGLK